MIQPPSYETRYTLSLTGYTVCWVFVFAFGQTPLDLVPAFLIAYPPSVAFASVLTHLVNKIFFSPKS